ncbi:MAG: antitoxin VbhA family protein [Gammaproteobacteria bacterium]|nr:antitoxin VbhA family protein [Gammaproteobacteria bacterium]
MEDDDGGYFDENGEWWLDDFGISQDDADKIFESMKVKEDNSLKQTLALLAVDNLSPSEHGLKVLKQYSSGELTYTQAIEAITKEFERTKPSNLH